MKAEEFDRKFDNNEDITPFLDLSLAHRPENAPQAVTLNLTQFNLKILSFKTKLLEYFECYLVQVNLDIFNA